MITLDQFIEKGLARAPVPTNAYVKEPGFKHLYVRIGRRLIHNEMRGPVLDLANLEASKPGNGAFTSLIDRLKKEYPDLILLVECVLNVRFQRKLKEMGFERVNTTELVNEAPSLWLPK